MQVIYQLIISSHKVIVVMLILKDDISINDHSSALALCAETLRTAPETFVWTLILAMKSVSSNHQETTASRRAHELACWRNEIRSYERLG